MSNDFFLDMERVMQDAGSTLEDVKGTYRAWSKTYEKNILSHKYRGPAVAVELLTQKLKEFGYTNEACIMDLACGTGLVGEQLSNRGYKNIDGVDLVPELLQVAKEKGIYGSLQEGIMGTPGCEKLGVAANQYDAAICVGALVYKHVPSEGLDDVVHVVKPGGLACFSIRELSLNDSECGFCEKIDQLSKDGKWKLVQKYFEESYHDQDNAWFFIYQVL